MLSPFLREGAVGRDIRTFRDTHRSCIIICMRTTLNIDDLLIERAARLTGVSEKTALVRLGLQALIAHESAKRLAALGGTQKKLGRIHRRRSANAA